MSDPEAHLRRLEGMIAGLERDTRRAERELAESQERRAEEARKGALGADWQAVQRRIDAGQTTLGDVFTGRDDSPAARRLLQQSQENLSRIALESPPPAEVLEELAAAEAEWDAVRGADPAAGQE